jgi:TonB family protein
VVVKFVVNEDGSISDIKVIKSFFPSLDAEAIRVTKLLSKFIPGTQEGKPVRVKFVLPITFRLKEDNRPWMNHASNSNYLPEPAAWDSISDDLDVRPRFVDSSGIGAFISKNLKYPFDAQNYKIGGVVIIGFIVNEDGRLSDFAFIHRNYMSLDKEAMRVAKLLPPFKPGIKNGLPVKSIYKLPVIFSIGSKSRITGQY